MQIKAALSGYLSQERKPNDVAATQYLLTKSRPEDGRSFRSPQIPA